MGDFSDSMEEVLLSKKKCLLSVTPTFYPSRFLFFKHILRDLVLQWNMIELLVYVIVELWLLLIQKVALNGSLAVVILSFSKIYPLNCGNMATSSSNIEQRCKSEGLKTLTKVIFIEKILLWKFVDFLKNYAFYPLAPSRQDQISYIITKAHGNKFWRIQENQEDFYGLFTPAKSFFLHFRPSFWASFKQ